MAAEGRPQAGPGTEERGFPTANPTKTRGAHGREPCPAGQARGEEEVAGLLLRAAGRRHHGRGGEIPGPPHAGKSPLPAAARAADPARDRGHPAGPRPPQPAAAAAAALGSPERRGEGEDATEGKVGFGSVSFYRVGCAPVHAGARVGRASGVPRGPGPAGRALRSQGPSPRLGPGSAARPLLPPPARPLARTLARSRSLD